MIAGVHCANLVQSQADEMAASLVLTNLEFELSRYQLWAKALLQDFLYVFLCDHAFVNVCHLPRRAWCQHSASPKMGLKLVHAPWAFLGPSLGLLLSREPYLNYFIKDPKTSFRQSLDRVTELRLPRKKKANSIQPALKQLPEFPSVATMLSVGSCLCLSVAIRKTVDM